MQSGRVAGSATEATARRRPAMAAQPAEAGLRSHYYACTKASRSALSTSALTVSIPCE